MTVVTGTARKALAKATRDTTARVGKRLRKVLMSSAENIKEFITPKAKKENVSVSPMAPRVTEPYFPGKRLSDRENKYFIKFLNLKLLPWQE